MSSPVISFTGDIVASAKARGLNLDHTEVAAINANLNTVATFAGGVMFAIGGRSVDLGEAVEIMSAGYGRPAKRPSASSESSNLNLPADATATERAVAVNTATRAGAGAANRERAAEIAETSGNPWSSKWANATRQAIITNHNPTLAERLKREAGVRP